MTPPDADRQPEAVADDELRALGQADPAPNPPATLDDAISADELVALGISPSSPAKAAPSRTAPEPPGFAPLAPTAPASASVENGLNLLLDVPLQVSVELGRISMTLQQVLALGRGAIIELERLAGEPVDILVNDIVIGRGEVVVVDEYFGVKITELMEPKG